MLPNRSTAGLKLPLFNTVSGMPRTKEQRERRAAALQAWLTRFPYFVGAILLHLIIFLMLATWVIFKAPVVHQDTVFQAVKIAPPPPPPPAPPATSGGEAANAMEPDVTVTPPPTPSAAITSNANAFTMAAVKVAVPDLSSMAAPRGSGLSEAGATGSGLGAGSVFGSNNASGNGFSGLFYDLKQTPDHKSTDMDADKEQALLKKFFSSGWNEDDWTDKFLRSPKPLYANELMVPFILSKEGPKAYGLADVCQPGYWCAIYHLKVSPSKSGTYRVAGYGDDFLVVRVDGDVVLDSGWFAPVTNFKRDKIYPAAWLKQKSAGHPDYGQTVVGTPFHLDVGDSVTIDVFIGDADPGNGTGRCGYFLFLMQDGKDYPADTDGNPILPVLQVQPKPNLDRPGQRPPFTSNLEDALTGS